VYENKPLGRIFGLERKVVTGGRKKSQSEEHHELYSALHICGAVRSRAMDLKVKKRAKDR